MGGVDVEVFVGSSKDKESVDRMRLRSGRVSPLYDPKFFIPLVSAALIHGAERLDIRRAIETNILSLAVMALASDDENMRNAGYFVLDWAHAAVDACDLKERSQMVLLLEGLKNAITVRDPPQRVPSVTALFVAQGLMILLKPESDMYPLVNRFLLQRPVIDLEVRVNFLTCEVM